MDGACLSLKYARRVRGGERGGADGSLFRSLLNREGLFEDARRAWNDQSDSGSGDAPDRAIE